MSVINGTSGNDSILGTVDADSISGFEGADTLIGLEGNDTLNGGFGDDTAEFSGASAGYDFRLEGGNVVVTDTDSIAGGNDGADRLIGVDAAAFTDGTVRVIAPLVGFQVDVGTPGSTEWPSVAGLPDGGFVVTWNDDAQDCYAQRFDVSGAAMGAPFRVNTTTGDNQRTPVATGLADGGFAIAWQSGGQDGSGTGIYAQRYDASGATVGGEFQVNTRADRNQLTPAITAVSDGGFVVAWMMGSVSEGQVPDSYNIYAQRYDAGGVASGPEFVINSTPAGQFYPGYPALAALPGGGFVATWFSGQVDGKGDVFVRRFDASGNALGSEQQVNTYTANSQVFPKIAVFADGGFVVAWASEGQDEGDLVGIFSGEYGVYAQRFDGSGAAVGAEFRVNTTTSGSQGHLSAAALPDGSFVVTWGSTQADSGDVYAQRYDANGVAVGTELRVNSLTSGEQLIPSIATLADGGYVVSWRSGVFNNYDIFAQRFDASAIESPLTQLVGDGGNNVITWADTEGVDLDGGAGNDTLTGGSGNDQLVGGTGADSLQGGAGDDHYDVDNAGDVVIESTGVDHVDSSVSFTLPAGVENLTLTGTDAINGTGNALDNILVGNSATNFLAGGGGNDLYYVDNAGDVVLESPSEGTDTVQSSVSFTLSSNVENLILTGGAQVGTGNSANNVLTGNSADNTLTGGAGDDTLNGGDGYDTAVFSGSVTDYSFTLERGSVVVTDTDTVAGGNDGIDVLSGMEVASFTDKTVRFLVSGMEFRVNTTTAGNQGHLSTAALPDGSFVVTWGSTQADSGDVYARHYDSSGEALGDEFRVNSLTSGEQLIPSITSLADGGYVVSWRSGVFNDYDIYAQRYDAASVAVGAAFQVDIGTPGSTEWPSIAALTDGGFVVTWNDDAQDCYAQRYDASGAAMGATFRVNTATAGSQRTAVATGLADGGFVVAWQSDPTGSLIEDIYAQRFDASGAAVGAEVLVNTTTAGRQLTPAITALSDGGFVVSWFYITGGVYGQRYDASGVAVGTEIVINGGGVYPSVAALPGGGFVATWFSGQVDGVGDAFVRCFDASGSALGSEQQVNTFTANAQVFPKISVLADGGFVVAWTSEGQDGDAYGVYGQRFDANGALIPLELNNFLQGGDGSDFMVGASGADTLNGAGGDDTLVGAGGADHMEGGSGADLYYVDNAGDVAQEDDNVPSGAGGLKLGSGDIGSTIDMAIASISYALTGFVENLQLAPGSGNINATGNTLDNVLTGNVGNNALDGGSGTDSAVYGGLYRNYTLTGNPTTSATITGAEGSDTLTSIEKLDFFDGARNSDGSWTADVTVSSVSRLYFGALNRPPDIPGLSDWVHALDAGQTTLSQVAGGFTGSAEFMLRFGSLDDTQFVNQLYQNILGRTADPGGLAYWLAYLGSGHTRGDTTLGFTDSPEYQTNTQADLSQGALTAEMLVGTSGDDSITGTTIGDAIAGLGGDDAIAAGAGNDLITGGPGNDSLDGGAGSDTAIYSGAYRQYLLTGNAAATATMQGPDDSDTMTSVERLIFVDGNLNFGATSHIAQVERVYLATLDRAGDVLGVNNWQGLLDSGAMNLEVIATAFANSPEFLLTYGGLNDEQFVTLLYANVLNRTPDPGGLDAWLALMSGGMTRGQVVTGFSESLEFITNTAPMVNAGLWDIDENAANVARLYLGALGQAPTAANLTNDTIAIRNGTLTLAQAADNLTAMSEFQTTYGSLGNEGFVDALYDNLLTRDPTGGEESSALAVLGTGDRGDVVLALTQTMEYQLKVLGQIDGGIEVL